MHLWLHRMRESGIGRSSYENAMGRISSQVLADNPPVRPGIHWTRWAPARGHPLTTHSSVAAPQPRRLYRPDHRLAGETRQLIRLDTPAGLGGLYLLEAKASESVNRYSSALIPYI